MDPINPFFERPILNSPYKRPSRYWELDKTGQPTQKIIEGRRPAEFISPIPKPRRRGRQQRLMIFDELARALETAIWLTDVAPRSGRAGKGYLDHLANANREANPDLPRLALKLATGTGKTTVMAMLIACWNFRHVANAMTRLKIESVCLRAGVESPVICSPDELMEDIDDEE